MSFTIETLSEDIKLTITGISYKENPHITYDQLRYLTVDYINFNGKTVEGHIICNQDIATDLLEIFKELYAIRYPIERIELIDSYMGDDEASMAANNTSCFNYRLITNKTELSNHALGLAIDINPFYNPYIQVLPNVTNIMPTGSEPYVDRNKDFPYKITSDDAVVQIFKKHGFTWGGDWSPSKDYQHFEKETSRF